MSPQQDRNVLYNARRCSKYTLRTISYLQIFMPIRLTCEPLAPASRSLPTSSVCVLAFGDDKSDTPTPSDTEDYTTPFACPFEYLSCKTEFKASKVWAMDGA